jgi:hypothetical protein
MSPRRKSEERKVEDNPHRVAIMKIFAVTAAALSPADLTDMLGGDQTVNEVRYHVAVLEELGELESAGRRDGAHGTEMLYASKGHPEHGA